MIALLGGTFDPVHRGHIEAALAAQQLLRVAEVRLVVASQPYHKASRVSAAEHRLAMVREACGHHEGLIADGSELGHDQPSYTVDLLARRRASAPRERRTWVIGMDAFADVQSWSRWEQVFALTNFLVFERQGFESRLPAALKRWLRDRLTERIDGRRHGQVQIVRHIELPQVSSTQIRRAVRRGGRCEHLLPEGVFSYIRAHQLYAGR